MAASKNIVLRNGIRVLGTLSSGVGDDLLSINATNKSIRKISPIDTSVYLTKALTSSYVLVGNSSDLATAVNVTGDVIISNTGVTSIVADRITNAQINSGAGIIYSKLNLTNSIVNNDIAALAGITRTKIATGNTNRVLINDAAGVLSEATAITASRILLSDANGIPIAADTTTYPSLAELSYVKGVTSSLQTQLGNRLSFSSAITPTAGDTLMFSGGVWTNLAIGSAGQVLTVSGGGVPSWAAGTSNGVPVGGSVNQYLTKIDATNYNTQWSTLNLAAITDVTANITQVNVLATGYYDATSSVQTQLDGKLSSALTTNNLWVGSAGVATATTDLPTATTIGSQYIYRTGGTDVTVVDGGTGLSAIAAKSLLVANSANTYLALTPGAGQSIRINAGNTAWEAYTPSSGSITNTAAANELMKSNGTNAVPSGLFSTVAGNITLGTSQAAGVRTIAADATSGSAGLTLSTRANGGITLSDVTQITGDGTSSIINNTATTNAVIYPLSIYGTSTGTPATGIGTGLKFFTETGVSNFEEGALIESVTTDVTSTSEDFDLVFKTMVSGATATEHLRLGSNKIGFFAATSVIQQTSGANLTNNVTVGGVNDTIANYTDLVVYANDAAAIRNDIYQLARKLKQVNDALRNYGLLT